MITILPVVWILVTTVCLFKGYRKRSTPLLTIGWVSLIVFLIMVGWIIWGLMGFGYNEIN